MLPSILSWPIIYKWNSKKDFVKNMLHETMLHQLKYTKSWDFNKSSYYTHEDLNLIKVFIFTFLKWKYLVLILLYTTFAVYHRMINVNFSKFMCLVIFMSINIKKKKVEKLKYLHIIDYYYWRKMRSLIPIS
jgi:hypothetical protein